jgi:hypothetical protein
MATVPKVTGGWGGERKALRRQKAQGGWNAEGKPQGKRDIDKDRAPEQKGERRRSQVRGGTGSDGKQGR